MASFWSSDPPVLCLHQTQRDQHHQVVAGLSIPATTHTHHSGWTEISDVPASTQLHAANGKDSTSLQRKPFWTSSPIYVQCQERKKKTKQTKCTYIYTLHTCARQPYIFIFCFCHLIQQNPKIVSLFGKTEQQFKVHSLTEANDEPNIWIYIYI